VNDVDEQKNSEQTIISSDECITISVGDNPIYMFFSLFQGNVHESIEA
jgi:predicted ATP-grasp superfamily ATP-dependent carboligase